MSESPNTSQESWSRRLWDDNRDLAEACLEHPFMVGLADGTLSAERYALFTQQDHFYLDAYARSYAWGAVRARDWATRKQFGQLLAGILTEGTLHEDNAPQLGISLDDVQPLPAAREYTDFLLTAASIGSVGEHLAAMAPCAQLYGWLGTRIADQSYDDRYAFWINMYAGTGYQEKVDIIMDMLDEHGHKSDSEAIKFRTAMELEYNFFDSAWVNGGS